MCNTNIVNINNQKISFKNKDNQVFCTSLDIARVFGRRHDNVLSIIDNKIKNLRKIGENQYILNFKESYEHRKIEGFKGITKYRYYQLNRDGFSLITMGLTGAKALKWQVQFIDAFNQMEKLLQQKIANPSKYLMDLMNLISPNLPHDDYKVSVIITKNPYSKESKNVFSLDYLVDNRTPKDPTSNQKEFNNE
ncbi:phage regulatory protein [Helicobacter monodelphidis]|uniref:Rha family transcriptional regulator n=1 Tax=Helicobacter sp. 15-1451 TaxID=2004995 RepID=UPI000DCC597F|nr:Rha family transcriptional regulator [Helicobacter sp. 15-1451]RAX59341.1 phage regulatory protein [Helicobacter sp. 15-1451]